VRAVFEAGLERPATDRRGFVDGACGGDEGVRREVERMHDADGNSHLANRQLNPIFRS
jgi:hypothetical protein